MLQKVKNAFHLISLLGIVLLLFFIIRMSNTIDVLMYDQLPSPGIATQNALKVDEQAMFLRAFAYFLICINLILFFVKCAILVKNKIQIFPNVLAMVGLFVLNLISGAYFIGGAGIQSESIAEISKKINGVTYHCKVYSAFHITRVGKSRNPYPLADSLDCKQNATELCLVIGFNKPQPKLKGYCDSEVNWAFFNNQNKLFDLNCNGKLLKDFKNSVVVVLPPQCSLIPDTGQFINVTYDTIFKTIIDIETHTINQREELIELPVYGE